MNFYKEKSEIGEGERPTIPTGHQLCLASVNLRKDSIRRLSPPLSPRCPLCESIRWEQEPSAYRTRPPCGPSGLTDSDKRVFWL